MERQTAEDQDPEKYGIKFLVRVRQKNRTLLLHRKVAGRKVGKMLDGEDVETCLACHLVFRQAMNKACRI